MERTVAVVVVVTTAAVGIGAVATAAVAVMMAAVQDMQGPQGRGGHKELPHCEQAGAPLDPKTGEPSRSDARYALNVMAFVVAVGAVLLRFGGRAALVFALGLDFATENPELRDGLGAVLGCAPSIGLGGILCCSCLRRRL